MQRIKFSPKKQIKFLKKVLENTNSPSIKELSNRFADISYSTWRNYFSEARLLPKELFENLCEIANLKKENFQTQILEKNWGQIKGGRIRKK